MRITVFTSNQPRHVALIKALAGVADEVFAVQECLTLFPGEVEDFYSKSEIMQGYFKNVIAAEQEVFGEVGFLPENVRNLALRSDDLNRLSVDILIQALDSDYIIIFGSSYIKPPLVDVLIEKGAINIHMGVSPYYRGAACNFWALYDNNAELVGATIHKLTQGLDDGDILFHAFPARGNINPFLLGMMAVRAAQNGLVEHIRSGNLARIEARQQVKADEIRYTKNRQFTDEIVSEYLSRQLLPEDIGNMLSNAQKRDLQVPYFDS